ncbi:hypothetical protein POJ06DRAFT_148789 [Lipomyces tetrasporus]|uniref:HMA domain-containing protein n=1 Tax=Lipomyces tetrasporus TaxID=54092 RepID=A0AAD7VPX3_9ASCO|nr:uncharacterized protein POJ06DRAFT_148789 [Lipomyces tetrasporus]KAJ8098302.1 hypothetical protein POJ06DRAFT_148789 [Lipomyces tetrasporus]
MDPEKEFYETDQGGCSTLHEIQGSCSAFLGDSHFAHSDQQGDIHTRDEGCSRPCRRVACSEENNDSCGSDDRCCEGDDDCFKKVQDEDCERCGGPCCGGEECDVGKKDGCYDPRNESCKDDKCCKEGQNDDCEGCGDASCDDGDCCGDKRDRCSDSGDKRRADGECCQERQDDVCEGEGACCKGPDEKRHAYRNDVAPCPVDETDQIQHSSVPIKCCGSDDDDQSLCSPSDTEKLVSCCLPEMDAPVKHKVLRFRPTRGKKKDNCSCDEQCVDRLAQALCEKECHMDTGAICPSHESVAKHYSSFVVDKRETLWRCICTVMEHLEMSASCCRENSGLATGQHYSFLYPRSVTTTAPSPQHHKLSRLHWHRHGSAQQAHSEQHGGSRHRSKNHKHGKGQHHMKTEASHLSSSRYFGRHDDPERALVPEQVSISVKGMTCSSCEKKVTHSLDKVVGVTSSTVSFLFEKAQIEYYPTITSPKQICAVLERMTGFKTSVLYTDRDAFYFISRKVCAADGVEMLSNDSWKVEYDPATCGARERMTTLGLEISDIVPASYSVETATRKIFGLTIDNETKQLCSSFLVALVLTIPILVLSWGSFNKSMDLMRAIVCLVLATIIQLACGRKIYILVYYTIAHGYDLDSDCLVALSTSIAYLYSLIVFALHRHGILLDEEEIYETSSLLLTFVLFGKLVTALIRRAAAEQVKFDGFQPTTVRLQQYENEMTPASLLQYGDRVVLDAGNQAATDGIIVSGRGEFEESHINGESIPILKKQGQEVLAGANLVSGSVVFRATRLVPENSVSNIKLLVNSVTSFRTRSSDIVELVAKYLIPVMIGVTCVVFIIWTLVGTQVRHQKAGTAISVAITYAIGTLAVSCPCAMVLVTPLVLSMGVAEGRHSYGVLLKSANPTAVASKVKHVVFDKTGTLTTDQLSVQYCFFNEETQYPLRDIIRAIVHENRHPISRAVSTYLRKFGDTMATVGEIENVVGSGMATTYKPENGESVTILCGKPSFLGLPRTDSRVARLHNSGLTLFCVGVQNGPILTIMGLTSTLREDCRPVLDALRSRGMTVHMLSGDTRPAVERLCRDLDISHYAAEMSPEGKNEYIEALKSDGSKVLFCGDGANDAIALAQADIGLSMTKEGITLAAADACVLNNEVSGVIKLLDLSKRINHRVIVGVAWACVYNLFAVLIVAGAFVRVRIGPAWAGVSEVISIVPVFIIALSMKWMAWRK